MSREVEDLNRRLLRARDAMDRAYAEPLDVRAVAAVAQISEAHFSRSFRAVFGETPHRYLQRRRVERSIPPPRGPIDERASSARRWAAHPPSERLQPCRIGRCASQLTNGGPGPSVPSSLAPLGAVRDRRGSRPAPPSDD